MNIEKEIKRQARKALHGNLSRLLAAAGVAALLLLVLEFGQYLVAYFTGAADLNTGTAPKDNPIGFLLLMMGYVTAVLLVSPVLNGFLRMAMSAAVDRRCDSMEVFYYFRAPQLWFKTVLINLLLYMMVTVSSSLVDIGTALAGLMTWIIRALFFLLFAYYPLMRYAMDERIPVIRCVFATLPFSFRNWGKAVRLALSFAGWFALCFFVLPLLYVVPYFAVAAMTSSRWLLELDKNRGVK